MTPVTRRSFRESGIRSVCRKMPDRAGMKVLDVPKRIPGAGADMDLPGALA